MKVDLSKYRNPEYDHGAGPLKRLCWHLFSKAFIHSQFPLPVSFKRALLRAFGARIGRGVVIKPNVNIKYPWFLEIGDHAWIGEEVWIDNLVKVTIGRHCCLSQGAMLLTGNHDFSKATFDLITGVITLGEGAWLGAKTVVCPGVAVGTHAVLTVASVATKDLEEWTIYRGNPAVSIKKTYR
ncbi:MAG: WcaF family extracellular polysaccharide biosynthesis acetyltransferase [Leadbetterella sp.]|nr:WcaF family extracellular polysaccharide biosynthesis acetyltransferase [Leadbetterella sp.]